MNKKNIPDTLHHLIPLVEEWGIGDDGYRCEKIEEASTDQLKKLIHYFTNETAEELNDWLGNPASKEPQTEEYYAFTSLFMAFEYAHAVLNDRETESST